MKAICGAGMKVGNPHSPEHPTPGSLHSSLRRVTSPLQGNCLEAEGVMNMVDQLYLVNAAPRSCVRVYQDICGL